MRYLTFLCLKLCIRKTGSNNSTYFTGLFYGLDECLKSGHRKGWGDPRYVEGKSSQGWAPDRIGRQRWSGKDNTQVSSWGDSGAVYRDLSQRRKKRFQVWGWLTSESAELSLRKSSHYCFYQHLFISRHYSKRCTWMISFDSHSKPIR